jgi:hypothetical protein
MREWVQRLAIAVRWLSFLWLAGWIVYLTLSDERVFVPDSSLILGAVILVPGIVGLLVAWALDGIAAKEREE